MLLALLIEDMMANDNNFSKNVFEEIRKAESMYDKEKESK